MKITLPIILIGGIIWPTENGTKDRTNKRLISRLLEKYGSTNIVLTDYWDADNTAIGLADKTKQYTVYITDNGNTDNLFFVSLENPPSSNEFPYTPGTTSKTLQQKK